MGEDKALLRFCGRPMVEIAVEKLRGFCAEVTIAGNREDLAGFAPVVREKRVEVGPAAGVEAGLGVATQPWAMFVPVDVPLVPGELLRRWAEAVVGMGSMSPAISDCEREQPAFCMLRRECAGGGFPRLLEGGERRLGELLRRARRGRGVAVRCMRHEFMEDGDPSGSAELGAVVQECEYAGGSGGG